jgi:CheY-like chemotaxis protein
MSYVLIVDDNADACETLGKFLTKAGHEVSTASNGQEALDSILKRLPDALVLDLFMPEMDGCDLLSILRSYLRLQALPVIIWTGVPDSPLLDRATRMHINGVCVKGTTSFEEILATIARGTSSQYSPRDDDPPHTNWSNA